MVLDLKICPACGDRAERPRVESGLLVCAVCAHRWPFRRLPLFALTGPSGAGKSTVGPLLARRLGDLALVVEQDVLWTGALRDDVPGHPAFRSTWLRMAAMLHQNGRPVVLCGTVAPPEFERLPERVFFSDIHYLALVSEPDALRKRLLARPAWREWDEERVEEMLEFNAWLQAEASAMEPPVELFDTTHIPVGDAVDHVEKWVRGLLSGAQRPRAALG
ncbi:AAA family ATPase [Amycolatopsis sp. EV170708-02-1]|uniref:AAA family ATPase n=1 Tax=Amycolatopsis sp. EV170708-02-1 TaxID=2919322 RepID=UPI001F0BB058|nr:AAA family ATPase [Amycolatopsis sp. EV170708-02-1]UMP02405.1 AAA family ATPase [Amycolatopsis sp. EV170708-02-1]